MHTSVRFRLRQKRTAMPGTEPVGLGVLGTDAKTQVLRQNHLSAQAPGQVPWFSGSARAGCLFDDSRQVLQPPRRATAGSQRLAV
jgi:hypothetical protein